MAGGGTLTARLDAFLPEGLADRYENIGARRAGLGLLPTLATAVQTGAFIGLGAALASMVPIAARGLPYGIVRLLAGLLFCLGLIPVVTMGAELFASSNLGVMAFVNGKVTLARLARASAVVCAGNCLGAAAIAALTLLFMHQGRSGEALAVQALSAAGEKCSLGFVQAVALGIMGNALICLAVWLCLGAGSAGDKVLATIFPVAAFVAGGFEHVVASMYVVPMGLLVKWLEPALSTVPAAQTANLTLLNFLLHNLLPVSLGNIVSGPVAVGLVYWLIYVRPRRTRAAPTTALS